jgi:hypothetical protein
MDAHDVAMQDLALRSTHNPDKTPAHPKTEPPLNGRRWPQCCGLRRIGHAYGTIVQILA